MYPYIWYPEPNPDKPWLLLQVIDEETRYKGKRVFIPSGRRSDGATGAFDIVSLAWWLHDELCNNGCFADGTLCTNLQASVVLYDRLIKEKRYIRSVGWFIMTFALGGGKARKNGMFKLKMNR